jgi:hypothetical protein
MKYDRPYLDNNWVTNQPEYQVLSNTRRGVMYWIHKVGDYRVELIAQRSQVRYWDYINHTNCSKVFACDNLVTNF